jgi:deazaflavin-dependent oxidoreductase (nitroreductase family)
MNPGWVAALVVLAALVAIVVAFIALVALGLRARVRWANHLVRRINRDGLNRIQLRLAGRAGATYALLHHRGRVTGAARVTPIGAVPVDGGFEVLLVYGRDVDWLKNLQAAGSAELHHDGHRYLLDQPTFLPAMESSFAATQASTIRTFRIQEVLRVRARPAQ